MQYTYFGSVLPDTTRVSSPTIGVSMVAGPDYPALSLRTQILDNRVVAVCDASETLDDVACLTIRNIAEDVASSICDSVAILEGAWTIVLIDTCVGPDGAVRMRFGNSLPRLKEEFSKQNVSSDDIASINLHPEGFHFRLALDDLNAGLMEQKFLRSHCYKAVEALKNSVCAGLDLRSNEKWAHFRQMLHVERDTLECLVHQEERHGDYANARQLSAVEMDLVLTAIAKVIGAYVEWFKREKLRAQ
jgi:hypothetical protein